jgi:hypothetical protein
MVILCHILETQLLALALIFCLLPRLGIIIHPQGGVLSGYPMIYSAISGHKRLQIYNWLPRVLFDPLGH